MPRLVYDRRSFTLAGFVRSAVFVAKEYRHRRPSRSYRPEFLASDQREEAEKHLATLNRDGIVLLPNYFQGQKLATLQALFAEAVKDKPAKGVADAWRDENACGAGLPIVEAALDDMLLQIIGGYYRKPFGLGRGDVTRLMPTPPARNESYQWHHDTRGRQIHGMILLNDVTSEGQRMSYLKGSHNTYYDRYRGESHGSRFESDMTTSGLDENDVVELAGPAGTVGLFDSNGLHSGNRNDKERRDCLLFCYVSHQRHFKHVTMRRSDLAALPPHKRKLLEMNPRLTIS